MALPESLWRDNALHLPADCNEVYAEILEVHGLTNDAHTFVGEGMGGHGGASKADTHKHFACLYLNSASRVQCVILDPLQAFSNVPTDLLMTLSSHRISILDMPCGAGAGAISLLTTIQSLRQSGVLPYTPLSVNVLGADISPHALELYEAQMACLIPKLSTCGINVRLTTRDWDATKLEQTTDVLDAFLYQPEVSEYLVLVANFSGASKKLFAQFEKSFHQVWIRLSGTRAKKSTILWVEPEGRSSTDVFRKIANMLKEKVSDKLPGIFVDRFPWMKSMLPKDVGFASCKYNFFHAIQNKVVRSGVSLHSYTREGVNERTTIRP